MFVITIFTTYRTIDPDKTWRTLDYRGNLMRWQAHVHTDQDIALLSISRFACTWSLFNSIVCRHTNTQREIFGTTNVEYNNIYYMKGRNDYIPSKFIVTFVVEELKPKYIMWFDGLSFGLGQYVECVSSVKVGGFDFSLGKWKIIFFF